MADTNKQRELEARIKGLEKMVEQLKSKLHQQDVAAEVNNRESTHWYRLHMDSMDELQEVRLEQLEVAARKVLSIRLKGH